jgi:hypothetical protein
VDGRSTYIISALREKRARVSAIVARLERQLDQHRADLTHIDGVLRLFEPENDPETARMRGAPGTSRGTNSPGFCREALREGELLSTDELAARVIEGKGFGAADAVPRGAIREQVLTTLRAFRRGETVEQIGLGRGVRWKLAAEG